MPNLAIFLNAIVLVASASALMFAMSVLAMSYYRAAEKTWEQREQDEARQATIRGRVAARLNRKAA